MTISVYLADLRHNYSGVLANDCMPLGIGYIKAVMDRELPEARSRLFAYPDRLWEAIRAEPPDVLMLSNYMWNEQLSLHLGRLAREARPETLVVVGGPNIHIEPERRLEYVRSHPEIDVYVLGEGEFIGTEVVRQFLDAGKSRERLAHRKLPSCVHRLAEDEVMTHAIWDRRRVLEDIPSPWLSGVMDGFFDGKLAPMIETNRGCPFTCTFCVQGTRWYSKVNYFPKERMREEIDYIGRRVQKECPTMGTLRIADSNYGMFKQDIEISGWIGEAQKAYGWPTYIDATTGKNRPERIIASLEQVNGALVLYQAVQTLDEEALRNVKRSNIKKEAYEQIMVHVRGRGLRSLSDLILGLPGETLESHLDAIRHLVDSGTHEMHNFQSMMLKGSEMETLESRAQYRFDTRFRVLPKNFGVYGGEKVFDLDEIVVATDTLSFDDYLEARIHHFVCSVFWNNSWFEDVVRFGTARGVKASAWLEALVAALKENPGEPGALLDRFVSETRSELFPTARSCIDFYSEEENFDLLREGRIGDNLMYKYRAAASFFLWPEICGIALDTMRSLIGAAEEERMFPDFDLFWHDLHTFVRSKHAHGTTLEELLSTKHAVFHYDIPGWIAAGDPPDPSPFRLPEPRMAEFLLPPEASRELRAALDVWSLSLKGLTKGVTRIRTAAQTRRCRWLDAPPNDVAVGVSP